MISISARSLVTPPPTPKITTSRRAHHYRLNHHYRPNATPSFRVKMSASQTIEHVLLFKVKPTADSNQITTMVDGLNGLRTLDNVQHLTAGPLLRNLSPNLKFTHMLHSRYQSKEDLANYSSHKSHLSVVRSNVLPICDDIMAVDWVAEDLHGPVEVKPGSTVRVKFVKLKDGLGDIEKEKVIKVFGGLKDKIEGIEQVSFGENFSAVRAKGFSIASLGVFPGVKELDESDSVGENAELSKEKDEVRSLVDNLVVVDYVVPSS